MTPTKPEGELLREDERLALYLGATNLERHDEPSQTIDLLADRLRASRAETAAVEKKIAELVAVVMRLKRGCSCEYDYRCGNCDNIIAAYALADKLAEKISS